MNAPLSLPLVIDTREPADLVTHLSMLLGAGVPIRREKLDSGDFLLMDHSGQTLGIERKTVADFLGSVQDGRLESQLERMTADYDLRLLLIQGKYTADEDGRLSVGGWSKKRTGWAYAAFQAKLLAVQGRYDTRVLVVGSDHELAILLRTLYRQGEEGKFHV